MTAQHTHQTDLATNQADDDPHDDGIDRRGFLKGMAWVGTGTVWTLSSGILTSCGLGQAKAAPQSDFSFIQISDSHIGFKNEPNQDVTATLQQASGKVNSLTTLLAFMLHPGDLSRLSKPEEFDTVEQTLKGTNAGQVFYAPGEHDVFDDNGSTPRPLWQGHCMTGLAQ